MKGGIVIPYLKKFQKYINHETHPLSYGDQHNCNFDNASKIGNSGFLKINVF